MVSRSEFFVSSNSGKISKGHCCLLTMITFLILSPNVENKFFNTSALFVISNVLSKFKNYSYKR